MAILQENETIAAVASGPGGAIAVIRISGSGAIDAAEKVWFTSGQPLRETPRMMRLGHAVTPDGEPCMAVFMPGPRSYTGENVVELQCHGGSFSPERLLGEVLKQNVRMAEPGEFTRRAFINGKMDLTQAEAVLDLIQAQTDAAANLAEKQLAGRLGGQIRAAAGILPDVLAEIESRMDFPEEELDWRTPEELLLLLDQAMEKIRCLLKSDRTGAIIRNGVRLVIAGAPNVGKSSLLNRILGYERAIVTNIPGTTRDTVEESAVIRGIQFRLTDTAGVREDAADMVESFGIERSRDSLRNAEVILWMMDLTQNRTVQLNDMKQALAECHAAVIPCWNKADMIPDGDFAGTDGGCLISAATGQGIEELFDKLAETVGFGSQQERESESAVAQRHAELLRQAVMQLESAAPELFREDWELAAVRIREAIRSLGMITGETASPDVLDEIFSRFCIGK